MLYSLPIKLNEIPSSFIKDSIFSNIKLCNAFSVTISILFLFLISIGFGTKSFTSSLSSRINLFLVSIGSLSYSLFFIFVANSLYSRLFDIAKFI